MAARTAKSAPSIKTCRSKVKQGASLVECKTLYTEFTCTNKDLHMLPFPTGFCANGWCENTKAKDWRGNPAPTCKSILICPCKCHTLLDRMFEMTGKERIILDASGYVTPPRTVWMPSDDPEPILSSSSPSTGRVVVESPAPDIVPATVRPSFAPTPTGRAARGELELWVKEQTDIWAVEEYAFPCTPQWVAAEIGVTKGISEPSTGAVDAVFKRWEALGFASIGRKPTRFIAYTQDGLSLGLEGLKRREKMKKNLQKAALKRMGR